MTGAPATTVTVSGAGFGAYEAVDIYFGTADQALASASGTGNFAGLAVQVPASAVPGRAYLTVVGRHSGLSAQAQFSVSNTVTVTSPGTQASLTGKAVSLQIQASDSASGQALTYTATGLPPGLSVNPSAGLISGTPSAAGTFAVTVTAQDTTGASGSATVEWTVHNTVTVTNPGTQITTLDGPVSLQIQASDSASGQTLTYTATGLPPGLSVNPSTGLISGTPITGQYIVTVTAQDTPGASGSATVEWDAAP